MGRFRYQATTEEGKQVSGVTTATSIKTAMSGLVEQGYDVSTLRAKRNVLQFEITKKKLKQDELMHFSRQLSAFVRAGIPLIESLEVIEEETDDKVLREVLIGVRDSLTTGETFSDALRPYESLFPKFYVDMVRAAEMTGSLDDVLAELAGYIKRDLEARNKIKSALVYPSIVLVMAVGTVIVLSTFVLPKFKTFFEGFNATLPLPTRLLLSFTGFMTSYWPFVLLGLVLLVAIPMAAVRTSWGRRWKDKLILRLPVIGQVVLFGCTFPPFTDAAVRRAFRDSVDLTAATKAVGIGYTVPSVTGLNLDLYKSYLLPEYAKPLEPNVDKAKADLAAAGWTVEGGNLTKDGKSYPVRLFVNLGQATDIVVAPMIIDQWKKNLGIDVKYMPTPDTVFQAKIHDYEMMVWTANLNGSPYNAFQGYSWKNLEAGPQKLGYGNQGLWKMPKEANDALAALQALPMQNTDQVFWP